MIDIETQPYQLNEIFKGIMMLTPWKKKFPLQFDAHSKLMLETKENQSNLVILLTQLDEKDLLDVSMLEALLQLHESFEGYLPELHERLLDMIKRSHISTDIVILLCNSRDPISCIQFIIKCRDTNPDSLLSFLSKRTVSNGLSWAMTLFDLSSLEYTAEYFNEFSAVATVFSNPLCRTIFDARLRGFSDYTVVSEPIDSEFANKLISDIYSEKDKEKKIAIFFNECATLRPCPPSQRYFMLIDVSAIIEEQLSSYCQSMIQSIESQEDHNSVRDTINTLRTTGGSLAIFNRVKYKIASIIESDDLYSNRSYPILMDEIWQEFSQPQVYLTPLPQEWEQPRVSNQTTSTLTSRYSLFNASTETIDDSGEMASSKKRAFNA
jgi:hypothetical protein